jgi:hypothetical protein
MLRSIFTLLVAFGTTLTATHATDVNCEICRAISDAVERVLVLNSTSSDTYSGVAKRLCHFLPEDLKHTCQDSVRQLPQSLYRCAVQEVNLNTICSDPEVGMCKVPTRPLTRVQCKNLPGYTHTCAACKFVVGGLEHYALDSIPSVTASLQSVCSVRFRDPTERKQCETFVADQGETAVRVAVSRLNAQDFCCAAGICNQPPLYVDKISPTNFAHSSDTNPPPGPVSAMMDGALKSVDL